MGTWSAQVLSHVFKIQCIQHTHTRTHTHTQEHTHTHKNTHTHMHTHTHTRTHTHMRTHTHAHSHARAHAHTHTHTHKHTQEHTHTHARARAYTHTNTHTHTHTHARSHTHTHARTHTHVHTHTGTHTQEHTHTHTHAYPQYAWGRLQPPTATTTPLYIELQRAAFACMLCCTPVRFTARSTETGDFGLQAQSKFQLFSGSRSACYIGAAMRSHVISGQRYVAYCMSGQRYVAGDLESRGGLLRLTGPQNPISTCVLMNIYTTFYDSFLLPRVVCRVSLLPSCVSRRTCYVLVALSLTSPFLCPCCLL